MLFLLLCAELVGLFFLSRLLIRKLYALFLLIFKAHPVAVSAVTLLLFPGTVIHELSHLFIAEILGVRTGKLTFAPESIRGEQVKTGSVAIAATGPLRRAAIGLAPVFAGILSLAALSYFIRRPPAGVQGDALHNALVSGVGFYLLFSVSNSMFSSREDLKGFWLLAITLSLFLGAAYAVGLRIALEGKALEAAMTVLSSFVQSLGLVLAVNGILLLTLHVLVVLMRKLPR